MILLLFFLFIFLLSICFLLYRFPAPAKPLPKHCYDAGIVLGCPCKEDGTLSAMQKSRMDAAIHLYHTNRLNVLLLSGGSVHNAYCEAEVMRRYALSQGVRSEHILLEKQAQNTFDNLRLCKKICQKHCFQQIVVVTSRFHLRRSAFFVRKFFPTFVMEAPRERGALSLWVQEYFRMWNTLYHEWRLSRKG